MYINTQLAKKFLFVMVIFNYYKISVRVAFVYRNQILQLKLRTDDSHAALITVLLQY